MRPESWPPNSGQPSALAIGADADGFDHGIEVAGHVVAADVLARQAY